MARNEIDVLRQEAEQAAKRALAADARVQAAWWSGNEIDVLRAADTLLLSLLQEARRKP